MLIYQLVEAFQFEHTWKFQNMLECEAWIVQLWQEEQICLQGSGVDQRISWRITWEQLRKPTQKFNLIFQWRERKEEKEPTSMYPQNKLNFMIIDTYKHVWFNAFTTEIAFFNMPSRWNINWDYSRWFLILLVGIS